MRTAIYTKTIQEVSIRQQVQYTYITKKFVNCIGHPRHIYIRQNNNITRLQFIDIAHGDNEQE